MVIGCSLVLAFNIGVPTDLIGFLFFAQVVGFVYLHRAESEGPQGWVSVKGRIKKKDIYIYIYKEKSKR